MQRRLFALLMASLLFVSLLFGLGSGGTSAGAEEVKIKGEHVPGEVVVKFKAGVPKEKSERVLSSERMSVKSESRQLGFKVVKLPGGTSVAEAVAELSVDPQVEYAEPNYIDHIAWTPDDPEFPNQWHMHDYGSGGMNAQAAWDTERGDSSVIIAVVDTGVAYENYSTYSQAPDLAGTTFVSPYDAVDYDGHPNDTNGHGTHVTGTIAQTTNNALGCSGVAHGCSIMPVRSLGTDGGSHAQMADAFTWAADHGADVINYSAGGSDSSIKRDACIYAYERGVTICAAYGNDGLQDPSLKIYPAAYDQYCVCVGATDRNKALTPYSNYGIHADVVGPGGDVTGGSGNGVIQQTYVTEDDPASGFSYQGWAGTSMATPHVSATAALFISRTGITNPGAVKMQLEQTARDLGDAGWDQYFGYGLIDANKALSPSVPLIQDISPTSGVPGDTVTINGYNFGIPAGFSNVAFNGIMPPDHYESWSDTQIKVWVPADAPSGPLLVSTEDGSSNGVLFVVNDSPVPSISSLSPNSAAAGGPEMIVTLNGSGFTRLSQAKWKGTPVTTTFVSNTRLTAAIPADEIAEPGSAGVTVSNPTPGGGTSNTRTFTVASPSSTWYLAEGTCGWGFETYISIVNPNTNPLNADITYMLSGGATQVREVYLPANSQTTVDPRDTVGDRDFSTKVVSNDLSKAISVDRTMSWGGGASTEAHSSVGVNSPSTTWYMPEGSTNWGFETWLCIQNPNSGNATCEVTYMIEGEEARTFTKEVPGNSRETYDIRRDIGNKDASIRVTSNAPVIPERSMYRNSRREGHESIGATASAAGYYLAEGTTRYGFTTYLCVQNPNDSDIAVDITYMTEAGPVPHPGNPVPMPANSRKTIRVNDFLPNRDFSTRVNGSRPVIAERSMYWDNGTGEACHDSIGMSSPAMTFYLPDGQTSDGRETYTCVQNPNGTAVDVTITYFRAGGGPPVVRIESIPANTRKTFSMLEHSGITGRASVKVASDPGTRPIMVERAMYWNSRGAGTDTIGGSD